MAASLQLMGQQTVPEAKDNQLQWLTKERKEITAAHLHLFRSINLGLLVYSRPTILRVTFTSSFALFKSRAFGLGDFIGQPPFLHSLSEYR